MLSKCFWPEHTEWCHENGEKEFSVVFPLKVTDSDNHPWTRVPLWRSRKSNSIHLGEKNLKLDTVKTARGNSFTFPGSSLPARHHNLELIETYSAYFSQRRGRVCVSTHLTQLCIHACSVAQFFATPWTIACQAPLSMELSWQEYWSGLLFPSPRDLPDPGIELASSVASALVGRFFTTE